MLLITSLVPILVFSIVSETLLISNSQKNTYEVNQNKLEIAKAEISDMLDKHFNTLLTIAKQPAIRNFDLASAKNILVDAVKVNSDLIIALDNNQGQQVVKSNDDALTQIADREFFKQAMNGNEKYVSDILVARATGKLIVVISTPVRDMNDNIIGVLQANIQLDQVSDFVTKLSEKGSKVYVLSRQGTVLAHPNEEYVQNQEDFSNLKFVQEGLAGKETTLRTKNIQGENVIVSCYLDELSGWLIVVETPVSVAMASAYNIMNVSVILFIVSAVIVGLLGLYFSKRFTKPLIGLSSIIKTIAMGDLRDFDIKIKSRDEIGELYYSLRIMTRNLRELISNIQTTASALVSHSKQLYSITEESTKSLTEVVTTISEMAQANSDQASMVQNTTEAITNVNNIVSQATTKTEVAADKAKESLELAKEGQKVLQQQSQKIEENNRYTKAVGESVQHLATMSNEIRDIVSVINGIAEQTNLLALNASIEAAHAGDAGRGFAVVAEEIRKLAEQSRSSTKKIEDIIISINDRVNEVVNNMNLVKESILVMDSSAENTKESFVKIFASITELAKITGEISTALEEINSQSDEITNQATNISSVVEETSASMEEISATSEEQLASVETIAQSSGQLEDMAQKLFSQVEKFKV